MRILLAAGAVGALFGAAAAVAVTKLGSPPVPPTAPESVVTASTAPPVRVPSSWNPGFLSRLADIESRIDTLERPPQAEPASSAGSAHANELERSAKRTAELDDQYRKDLEIQEEKLGSHAREPIDPTWARTQSEVVTRTLEEAVSPQYPMRVESVDCRSATCVAQLVYNSPDDALADRDVLTRKFVTGCRGLSSALTPPTGPGEYTTSVVYNCR